MGRRVVRYGRRPCKHCGAMVTKNALGRAAHERSAACSAVWQRREAEKERAAEARRTGRL